MEKGQCKGIKGIIMDGKGKQNKRIVGRGKKSPWAF